MFGFPFATYKSMFACFSKYFCRDFYKLQILTSMLTWFFTVIFIKLDFANALSNRHLRPIQRHFTLKFYIKKICRIKIGYKRYKCEID